MRVFALLLAVLACAGYARRVQKTEAMEDLMSADEVQAAERMEDALLAMSLDADKMTQVVADAKFQGEALRLVEPIMDVLEDPKMQQKARRVVTQMEAVISDPSFAQEAKRIAEQIQALLAGVDSPDKVTDVMEYVQALMADSSFQEQAKRIIEPMMGMIADPEVKEQAKHAAEQIKEVMGSKSFQQEAKRITKPIKSMMESAQELMDVVENQEPMQSLASLLLASPALTPTLSSPRAASAPLQRARMPVASATDDIEAKTKGIIAEQLGVDEDKVTPSASFTEDLGADSLDAVELIMAIEEAFDIEIPDEEAEKMTTPADCVTAIKAKLG